MSSFRIHIDSRSRDNYTNISSPTLFSLSKSICNTRGVRVKWVQFSNTVHNIRFGQNDTLLISTDNGVSFSALTYIQSGFYSNTEYVSVVNTYLQTLSGVVSTCVTLNETTNALSWTLPTGMYIDGLNSNSKNILGLADVNLAGTFTSKLFLASPMSISFVCPQLQSTYNVFSSDSLMSRIEPF
jgi:hypothetical protein